MSTTKLQIIPDINAVPSYTLPQSNVIYTGLLAANVAQSVTAPTDASRYMVRIGVSNGSDILVSVNGTAAVPTDTLDAATTEVNIAQTYVSSGGTVSVITPDDNVIVSLGFYAIQ
jgi:hypothetical protein